MLHDETANDSQRRARALAGLRAYQQGPRQAPAAPRPVVAQVGRVRLRRIGDGTGPPLVLVPSLINPPDILDLSPEASLGAFLAHAGFAVSIVDWGTPDREDAGLDLADHVAARLQPLLDSIERPLVLGYCLGGTLAIGLASLVRLRGLVLLAAPWRFSGFAQEARTGLTALWTSAKPLAEALGVLPIEALQAAFWQADPNRTVAKFEAFAELDPRSAEARAFIRLEDWANQGAPLPFAAARELAEGLFGRDEPGTGNWLVDGRQVDPSAITCPVLNIVSTCDRIVPAESAAPIGVEMRLAQGHVGMVIGRRARATLWEPLAGWLSAVAAT